MTRVARRSRPLRGGENLFDVDRIEAVDGAAELATVERLASGPAAAVDALERLGLDLSEPANEVALRAWAQHLALDIEAFLNIHFGDIGFSEAKLHQAEVAEACR